MLINSLPQIKNDYIFNLCENTVRINIRSFFNSYHNCNGNSAGDNK